MSEPEIRSVDSARVGVVIPFVRVDASQNPNLRVRSGADSVAPYYRAMVVAFASLRRFNADLDLVLATNESPPEPFPAQLTALGVVVQEIAFDHRPPAGFSDRFTASLFLIDALAALSHETSIILDPDVLCIRSIEGMLDLVDGSVGALRMDYSADRNVNGISRREAGVLHGLLGEPIEAPEYFGGEIYVIPASKAPAILARCEAAWALSLERHKSNMTKFLTEEHVLNYALRSVTVVELSKFVKRIWTAHRFRTVDGTEHDLTFWHLPAEKDRGFAELYQSAKDSDSWFWKVSQREFVSRSGRAMGFHHRSLIRFAADSAAPALHRLQRALGA